MADKSGMMVRYKQTSVECVLSPSTAKFEIHQDIGQSIKAIDALVVAVAQFFVINGFDEQLRPSKQQLKTAMTKGALWLTDGRHTHRLRRASRLLKASQQLHFYYDHKVLSAPIAQASLLCDCQDYSLWYKPKGMMSQGSKWSDHSTIVRVAQLYFQPERQGFIVHRLDRATDGIVVVGHTKKATQALCDMFASRRVDKRYLAVVKGQFPVKVSVDEAIDGKHALSHCSRVYYDKRQDLSLVEVKIDTGRKHQIRRHLSGLGFAILGDRLYGFRGDGSQGDGACEVDLQLCAYAIAFVCPIKNQAISVELEPSMRPTLINDLSLA